METAVVCSGQEPAPGLERSVGADAEGPAFVAGGDEPEQQLSCGVVEGGGEAESSTMT